MILQALTQYYDALNARGEIDARLGQTENQLCAPAAGKR